MSAAAAFPKITPGFTPVPNSFIENSSLLTDNERQFALVAMRWGLGKPVTSSLWCKWTSKSERAREYAIRGLTEKGVLKVEGKGEQAKFVFSEPDWNRYVREADRTTKPKTAGARKAVPAKAGAMVHPECREQGCFLVRRDQEGQKEGETCKTLIFPSQIAQPVAQTSVSAPASQPVTPASQSSSRLDSASPKKTGKSLFAASIAQPVAQMDVAALFPLAFALLVARFAAGVPLLRDLLAKLIPEFGTISDSELQDAIELAAASKRNYQKSPGLLLETVPEQLRAKRAGLAPPGSDPPKETAEERHKRIARMADKISPRNDRPN